jgi:hypothetical protein
VTHAQGERLRRYIEAHLGRPFVWGELDCYTLALGWVDELLGTTHRAGIAGAYSSAGEALELWRTTWGGRTWESFLLELGAWPLRPLFQQTGDLMVGPGRRFETVGIMTGRHVLTIDEARELVALDVWQTTDPWRPFRLVGPRPRRGLLELLQVEGEVASG